MSVYDCIVVGAGIAGSSAAYEISKTKNTLLLEQFELLHSNGSSHGNSRIYRKTYPVSTYSKMCIRSLELWKLAEKESGMKVYNQTGGLDFGPKGDQNLNDTISVCKELNIDHQILSSEEISKKFPHINPRKDWVGLYQKDAGILNATEACRMYQYLAASNGCLIHAKEKVIDIKQIDKNLYYVKTSKSFYLTKKIVLCCGGWAEKMLKHLGVPITFEVWKCTFSFWNFDSQYKNDYQKGPIFITFDDKDNFYGFPSFEYPDKFKASIHFSEDIIDPDQNNHEPSKKLIQKTEKFVKEVFKGVKGEDHSKTCLYTVSKDENFVIDYLPNDKNIVIFAGGSGHAFKFGSCLGEIMNAMVNERKPLFDLSLFSIQRLIDGKLQKGPSMLKHIQSNL